MGGSTSTANQAYHNLLLSLTDNGTNVDQTYWDKLMEASPIRDSLAPPDPLVIHQIATKCPEKLISLLTMCVKVLKNIQESQVQQEMPDIIRNRFSMVLQIFSISVAVLGRDPKLHQYFMKVVNPVQIRAKKAESDDEEEKIAQEKSESSKDSRKKKSKRAHSEDESDEDRENKKSKRRSKKKVIESDDEIEETKSKKSKHSKGNEEEKKSSRRKHKEEPKPGKSNSIEDLKPKEEEKKRKGTKKTDETKEKPSSKSEKTDKKAVTENEAESSHKRHKSRSSKGDADGKTNESQKKTEEHSKSKKKTKEEEAPKIEKKVTQDDESIQSQISKKPLVEQSLLSKFISTLNKCMFKKYVTVSSNGPWEPLSAEKASMALSRFDIVHCVLALSNIGIVAGCSQPIPKMTITASFPRYDLLISSICKLSASFVNEYSTGSITVYIAELMKNLFALTANLQVQDPRFSTGFQNLTADDAIAAFTGNPMKNDLIFDPTSPFSSSSLSFLYLTALHCPLFVKELPKRELSNRFVFDLIYTLQYSYEKVGVCFIHSILLSTLMLLFTCPATVKALMNSLKTRPPTVFRAHASTYADLLVEVMLNLSDNENLLPSIVCLLHTISKNITDLSLYTLFIVMKLFNKVTQNYFSEGSEKNRRLVEIFVESFARNIYTGFNLRVLLVQNASLFRKLNEKSKDFNKSLQVIILFLNKAKQIMAQANKKTMETKEAYETFKSVEIKDLFKILIKIEKSDYSDYYDSYYSESSESEYEEEVIITDQELQFEDHQHILSGEMKKTWTEWARMLATKALEMDTEHLKVLTLQ